MGVKASNSSVLVLGLLSADALGQGHPVVQFVLRRLAQFGHLALNLSQDDPDKGPLPDPDPESVPLIS